jgi:hypothetical protein
MVTGADSLISDVIRRVCGVRPSDNDEMVKQKRVTRIYFSLFFVSHLIFSNAIEVSSKARGIEDCVIDTAIILYKFTV